MSWNIDNASKMVIVGTEWRSVILLDNWDNIPKPKKGAYIEEIVTSMKLQTSFLSFYSSEFAS